MANLSPFIEGSQNQINLTILDPCPCQIQKYHFLATRESKSLNLIKMA